MNRSIQPLTPPAFMRASWPFDISLTDEQDICLQAYANELRAVNRQFNLVSRADEAHMKDRHVGHCLALGERRVLPGTQVIDWGTGGGLPAIILGVLFPDVQILGVDSNNKKTRSVDLFARRLGISNVHTWHGRAEVLRAEAHLSVSRATAPLETLWAWHAAVALEPRQTQDPTVWKDGLLCLKGGHLDDEVAALIRAHPDLLVERIELRTRTSDPYFAMKEIIHVSVPAS